MDAFCLGNTRRKVEYHSSVFRCLVLRHSIRLLSLQHRCCLEEEESGVKKWMVIFWGLWRTVRKLSNNLLHEIWARFKLAETKWQSIIYSTPSPTRSSTLRKTLIKIFEGSWQSWKWVASVKQEEIGVMFQILASINGQNIWVNSSGIKLFYIARDFSLK